MAIQADVSDRGAVEAMFKEVWKELGHIDICRNDANGYTRELRSSRLHRYGYDGMDSKGPQQSCPALWHKSQLAGQENLRILGKWLHFSPQRNPATLRVSRST
jgi:hypothetical protein